MDKTLILIDTSYTLFYRFYATIRWYSFKYPEEFNKLKNNKEYDWYENELFKEKFEKLYLESIIKACGKKVFNNSDIILCADSSNNWRVELFCDYKASRKKNIKYNFENMFNYSYNTIIPNILKYNKNIKYIKIQNIEADDIIGCICINLKENKLYDNIYIFSGDDDFLQLGRENIIFINFKNKKQLTETEAYYALQKKIILGDKSDCINGILSKGKKNKDELLKNKEVLKEYLLLNPEINKKYIFNDMIINFDKIPLKYYNQIIKIFNKLSINV